MLAAVLAEGVTVLEGAAREPEIEDLARLLISMGARIENAGKGKIILEGVSSLGPATHRVIPDRIEAGTLAVAAALTGGDITIADCRPEHLQIVIDLLAEQGISIEKSERSLRVCSTDGLTAFSLRTEPYPGFPTDLQAQFCTLATQAKGYSLIEETIFENRFLHVPELVRLGAEIQVTGNQLHVRGPTALSSAPVMASDLRASAALVLAALVAEGTSEINRIYHLDRGYENLDLKLSRLGARIRRISALE
jgi:UDP-N-acetylglucosamine 1-carboxyvinyltransferase